MDTKRAAHIRRLIAREPGGRAVLARLRSRPDILWQAWMADLGVQAVAYVVRAMRKVPPIWWARGNSLELAEWASGASAEFIGAPWRDDISFDPEREIIP